MKLEVTAIKPQLVRLANWFKRYYVILAVVAVAAIYGWLILQINLLNRREPTEADVTAKLQSIKQPRIDQKTVDKIQQLQDNSVDVQAIFKSARDNPFQE